MNKALLFILILFPLASNGQNWVWARGASGSTINVTTSSVTDVSGNVYVAGNFFTPSITFGTTTLTKITDSSELSDVFLVKYDSNGNVIWAENFGASCGNTEAPVLAVDDSGNLYLAGIFGPGYVTFGSVVIFNTSGINRSAMFLVKLDTAGTALWGKGVNGESQMEVNAIRTDHAGNIFVTGSFGGIGTIIFDADTVTHTGNGAYLQPFVVKYRTDGSEQWAKTCGGINSGWSQGNSVTTGKNGNCYVTGFFNGPDIIFGTDTLINSASGFKEIFLTEYDSLGQVIWAKRFGGSDDDMASSTNIDSNSNFLYVWRVHQPYADIR